MFIVGIDIAKRSHEAIIIAEDGQVVRKAFSFRNNCTGYNLLLEQVRRLTLVKSQIVFAMESTAHYWLALYARLLKDGYAVMVLNPIQSHSLRELYIRLEKARKTLKTSPTRLPHSTLRSTVIHVNILIFTVPFLIPVWTSSHKWHC